MKIEDGSKLDIRFPHGKHSTQVHGKIRYDRRTSKQETELEIKENMFEEIKQQNKEKELTNSQTDPYFQLYEILKNYPLYVTIYKDFFTLQNEGELVGVKRSDKEKLKISYLTTDREVAQKTLSGCPVAIKYWEIKLFPSIELKEYKAMPYFSAIFDFKDALEVSSHLCDKMISNDPSLEKLVLH